jgi:hypothetical protein
MIAPRDVISLPYKALQVELHSRPNGYGGKGNKWAPSVSGLIDRFHATSVLDYGCGEGTLMRDLRPMCDARIRLAEYDPGVPSKDAMPGFADLVVCTDVLEHVEPDLLDGVLVHLRLLARKAIFAVIATRPSGKTMADGRNAHLIVEQAPWWTDRLMSAGFVVEPGPSSPLDKPSRELSVVLT